VVRVLSRPQREVLRRVAAGEGLAGLPGQSVHATVGQGLVRPGPEPELTEQGRKAFTTGQGKPTARVGGLVWCRITDLEPGQEGKARVPVWGVYGPAGPHLLIRGEGVWWLRMCGVPDRGSVRIAVRGVWAARTIAAEHLLDAGAPVWDQVRR